MATKKYLRQDDFNRVVITELIPYEIPIRFTFFRFYELLSKGSRLKYVRLFFLNGRWSNHDFIPFTYSIQREGGKTRNLGLVHPLLFSNFVDFYKKYAELITNVCRKSSMSLRAPKYIAKTYFKRNDEPEEEVNEDAEVKERKFTSTFFLNRNHDLLYKFFESKELIELESRFENCFRLDVSNCFNNIYTHSICWAVNTKEVAKSRAHRGARSTFDAEFDILMRRSNHGETHGIVVGPEVSRIFAEIIFQEIDVRLEEVLARYNLVSGIDYEARRYLDDYFIFHNSEEVKLRVRHALQSILEKYKLFLNDSKDEEWRRPFVTSLSIVKGKLQKMIDQEVGYYGVEAPASERRRFERLVGQYRLILAEHRVSYSDCSSYFIKELARRIERSIPGSPIQEIEAERYVKWVAPLLEVSFFIFSIDPRFQISVNIGRILIAAKRIISMLPSHHRNFLGDLIKTESSKVMHKFVRQKLGLGIELASFLISLKGFDGIAVVPRLLEQLVAVSDGDNSHIRYFTTIAFLYYCGGNPNYESIVAALEASAIERILSASYLVDDSELFCMTLDLLACPYISVESKRKLARRLLQCVDIINPPSDEINRAINEFSSEPWLFDWRADVDTEIYFEKKELSFGYQRL